MSQQRYEGTSLASVLAEVRERFGEEVDIVEANKVRRGGLGGFFAKERYEVVVEAGGPDPAAAGPRPPTGDGAPFAERLLSLADDVDDVRMSALGMPVTSDGSVGRAVSVSTEQADFASVLAAIRLQAGAEPAAAPAPPADPAPPAPSPPVGAALDRAALGRAVVPAPMAAPASGGADALFRIGLPAEIAQGWPPGADPAAALFEMAARLARPAALPEGRGAVVAVVGDRADALTLARSLSAEIGVDADQLILAAPEAGGRGTGRAGPHQVPLHRQITGADLAGEQRRSWRRRPRPTIVAVDCPPGSADSWAARILDALEPTMVWGAVDASRKPEDISAWAEHLGGIDALAVSGLDQTVSPAAILRCGIPVGRLDGAAATPAEWTARLAPRLAVPLDTSLRS